MLQKTLRWHVLKNYNWNVQTGNWPTGFAHYELIFPETSGKVHQFGLESRKMGFLEPSHFDLLYVKEQRGKKRYKGANFRRQKFLRNGLKSFQQTNIERCRKMVQCFFLICINVFSAKYKFRLFWMKFNADGVILGFF